MPVSPQLRLNCAHPKVLIVEDEEELLDELALALEFAEVSVMCANNGLYALELLDQHPELCIVLLDWRMAGISGSDLMAAINANIAPQRPVALITMSGAWTDEEQQRAIELGAVACVTKPCHLSTISKAIDAALSQIEANLIRQHRLARSPLPKLEFLDDDAFREPDSAGST